MSRYVARFIKLTLLRSKTFARLFRFRQPPILVLSYPRSGSSWVGDVLATSPSVAYLREPVTQPFIQLTGRQALDPITDEESLRAYDTLAHNAFLGIRPPACPISSVFDFLPPHRGRKQLLIKEVNPNATVFYHQQFDPVFVLLLRHPAAVALSFMDRGWLSPDNLESFAQKYGKTMSESIAVIPKDRYRLVLYEELAENPEAGFRSLFQSLELRLPEDFAQVISRYCESGGDAGSPYETRRLSASQINKWRTRLSGGQIQSLHTGHVKSPLEFYRDASDWEA
jgi:hypothetical protein